MAIPNPNPDLPEPSNPGRGPQLTTPPVRHRTKSARSIPPIFAWIGAAFIILVLVLAIALTMLINNPGFHRYVIRTVQDQAAKTLGVPVELQNFALHLSSLSLDLYGVTVHGASPYANPPLLQVQHAEAGIRIVSLLQRKWYFSEIRIDHPVVHLFVDKNGASNLPRLSTNNNTSGNTGVFDLGIRHAILDHGEVFYDNQPAALAADFHDFSYQGSFDQLLQMYSGHLSYADGRLQYGSYRPLLHDFAASFNATPSTFQLTQAKVASGTSSIALTATVNNYTNPIVQANYDASLDGALVSHLLQSANIPTGMVHATGTLQYQQAPNQPLLQALTVNGNLTSQKLAMKTSSFTAGVDHLAAHYSLANGDAIVHDLRADIFGGQLTASGVLHDIGGKSHSRVDAALHRISLADMRQALGRAAASTNLGLTGSLDASASATWGATLDDLVARADANLSGQVTNRPASGKAIVVQTSAAQPAAPPPPATIPITSVLHATYSARSKQASLAQSFLRTPQTSLTMNGAIGDQSSLALNLQANNLREVSTIVDLFRTPQPGQSFDLAGTASFQGNVQGNTSAPHLTGQLNVQNLRLNGTTWKVVRTGVDVCPSQARLQNADLELASQGRIRLNASAGLTRWSFTDTNPIQADLNVSQINLSDVEKLAGQDIPVTGILNANLHVHGSELNPQGNGNISLVNGVAYEQPFQSLKANLSGNGDEAKADLQIQTSAGNLQGQATVRPKQKSYIAQLASNGVHLDQLQALKTRNIDASGVLSLHANGQGTFDNPQLNASLQIPNLTIQKQSISAIILQLNLANHIADANLTSSAVNTSIQAKAKINLTGDYLADASLDTQKISLQTLLATYAPDQADSVSGQTEVHATLHGPLKDRNLLEAHITIPVLNATYNNTIQLAAVKPIQVVYKNGVINLQPGSIHGTDTDLQFQGSIPTTSNAPMSLKVLGTVDLQLAQLFDPDVRSSGQMKFNIDSSGAVSGADLGGEIDIVDANFASSTSPVGLQHGNGVLTMTRNRVNISKFEGTVGGGTVTAQGGIVYRPDIQFDLGLAAKNVRVLYPEGMRESADAYLRLTGTTESALVGGTVNISDLSFTPAFDLNNFIGQFSGGVIAPPSQGFSQNVALNIAVHSSSAVNLVSRSLSVGGSANLQVRGTAADPVLLGRVNLSGGDIILNGNRFVLTGGTVQFINPSETEPVVNLTLTTTIQQYNINLRFNGPSDQLRTQYTSNPALPTADIINLLAFGETTEAAANSPSSANQAAESLVASQVSSQVTSRVSKIAGISQLSINPVLAGSSSQGPPGANITIQQRVTGNLFVTFSTNVASTQSQTIQGQYQVSPRVAVSATRDPNGGFAFDTLIKKSW
ncbi:MAG: translocation/assembly module TamB domain-containing protein [Terracidiphilus sp.]